MFRKIVSRLPFQPGLLPELVYYSHRLNQEQSVRRLGLVLVSAVLVLQTSMIIFPAKSSIAANTSDIVYGATSKQDVLNAYRNNRDQIGRTDIQKIFNHYGIAEAQIENAKIVTISDSDDKSYINTSRSATKFPDTFVSIPGASNGGIYEFPLMYWRKGEFPNGYPAITGMSSYGFRFWILLKGCGNIVFEQDTKKPSFEIKKQRISAETVLQGQSTAYQIQFRNNGLAAAKDTTIIDTLQNGFEFVKYSSNIDLEFTKKGQTLRWSPKNTHKSLSPSTRWFTIDLEVKVSSTATGQMCNVASITAYGSISATSTNPKDMRCVTIQKPTCPGTGLPIPASGGIDHCLIECPDGKSLPYNQSCPTPQLTCESIVLNRTSVWNERKASIHVLAQPGAVARDVRFYVDGVLKTTKPLSQNSTTSTILVLDEGTHKIHAIISASKGQSIDSSTCTTTTEVSKPLNTAVELTTEKHVSNITKNIVDANNTTASAGDILKYTVIIENIGTAPVINLKLEGEYGESIGDVLEYANLVDTGDALHDPHTHFLTWPAVTIEPGRSIEKTFTVQIKSPIPSTPTSASNPLSFDTILHNKYGNDVFIKVDRSSTKAIEQTVATLPNTGPGTSFIITWVFTVLIGYFYYRVRLLRMEALVIARVYTGGL